MLLNKEQLELFYETHAEKTKIAAFVVCEDSSAMLI